MQIEVIEVAEETTLGSLLTHIEGVGDPVVILLGVGDEFPRLDSPVQWAAIKRRATRQGLRLVMVSQESKRLRFLAQLTGIPVASSVTAAEAAARNGRHSTSSPIGFPEIWQHPDDERTHFLRRVLGRPTGKVTRPRPLITLSTRFRDVGLLLFLLMLISSVVVGTVLLVPSAEVTLVPMREPINAQASISAVIGISSSDFERLFIPARTVVVDVEGTGEIPTTGSEEVPDATATGTVIFVNQRPQPITIPAGTVVATSTGTNVRFHTTEEVSLPSAVGATVEATIEAENPGPSGNVRAFSINTIQGPLSLLARVVNENPTIDGTMRQANVVTRTDKENLRQEAERELREAAYERLSATVQVGEYVPPETISTMVLGEIFDRFVDEPTDTLGLKLRIRATGLAVDVEEGRRIALSQLEDHVPPGSKLLADGISVAPGPVTAASGDQVQFTMDAIGYFVRPIKEEEVGSIIYGLPLETVETVLLDVYPLARPPEIKVTPAWYVKAFGLMPLLPWRVNVHTSYDYSRAGE